MATEEKFYIKKPEDGTRLSTTGSFGWNIDPDDPSTYDQTLYFTTKQEALNEVDRLAAGEYVINSVFVKTN
tara:strand:- start:38835 stop:39047 length:213 start_codon:yes stop_codon:yes gene_type:complete